MLDLDFVRARFPALATDWALLDNAGGSAPARAVLARVEAHMARRPVQLGATYPLSVEASAHVEAGRAAAARLLGATPEEIVLGPSSTACAMRLAEALRPLWKPGDEIVVTNLDHEANIGPWRRLEATGIVIREWRFRPESMALEWEDLEPLLSSRTRLVAFTHCSNLVGRVHDVRTLAARVREAGAWTCVDGVAFAPHGRVDVRDLGVDFYLVSLYKTWGPHVGVLYARRELLARAKNQNHVFVGEDAGPAKLEPGGVCYELVAAVPGILDYLAEVDQHHGGAALGPPESALDRAFGAIAAHEAALVAPLLAYLDHRDDVHLYGPPAARPAERAPTVSFSVAGWDAGEIPPLLERHRLAVRYGHFYAWRAVRDLGLAARGGVVRASLVHYNTPEEVERLVLALEAEVPRRPTGGSASS